MPDIDSYINNTGRIQDELIKRLEKLIKMSSSLNTAQIVELGSTLNLLEEMSVLGYSTEVSRLMAQNLMELTAITASATALGVELGSVDLVSIQYLQDLEITSILGEAQLYANQLKQELFNGLLTGESVESLAGRLQDNFGAGKVLTSSQKMVAVSEGFSRLKATTTAKVFEGVPQQKFLLVGPLDGVTRDACFNMLSFQGDGLTRDEIDRHSDYSFIERGGFNCRHDWVPV